MDKRPRSLRDLVGSKSLIRTLALAFFLLNTILYIAYTKRHLYIDRFSSISSSSAKPHWPSAKSDKTEAYVEEVRSFWQPWADIIVSAKPPIKVKVNGRYGGNGFELVPTGKETAPRPPAERLIKLSDDEIKSLAEAHKKVRQALNGWVHQIHEVGLFEGKGVVLAAGGKYLPPAMVNIYMLRASGSKLPVEMWFSNWSEYNEDVCERLLPDLNARCMVLSAFIRDTPFESVHHYQMKVMTLLFSNFQEVVFLDSDNIPLIDPAIVLEHDAYIATGFLGWPDYWVGSETPDFYTIAGLKEYPSNLPYSSAESGQLVVDKKRHLKTLILAAYYNFYGPSVFYRLQSQGAIGQGDKTTFEAAVTVLGLPRYRIPTPPKNVVRDTQRTGWKHAASLQYQPSDFQDNIEPWRNVAIAKHPAAPAFLHANHPKMNGGQLAHGQDLTTSEGEHIRIWGKLERQQKTFGEDVEKRVWAALVDSACDIQDFIREWKQKGWNDTCLLLREHQMIVFQ